MHWLLHGSWSRFHSNQSKVTHVHAVINRLIYDDIRILQLFPGSCMCSVHQVLSPPQFKGPGYEANALVAKSKKLRRKSIILAMRLYNISTKYTRNTQNDHVTSPSQQIIYSFNTPVTHCRLTVHFLGLRCFS